MEKAASCEGMDFVQLLPRELISMIFAFLALEDWSALLRTSKSCHSLIIAPSLWEERFAREYGSMTESETKKHGDKTVIQRYFAIKKERIAHGWQVLVDNLLQRNGPITHAAIFCNHTGAIWAKSENFTINEYETKQISSGLIGPEGAEWFRANGVTIGSLRYIIIRIDDGHTIMGKRGAGGCIVEQTKKAIIVGIYTHNPPIAINSVLKLAEYLKSFDF